jgi:fumarate reductase subunit D
MPKRILIFGAISAVATSAVAIVLSVLDIISPRELTDTLTKSLSVIAVTVVAIVLTMAMLKASHRSSHQRHEPRD